MYIINGGKTLDMLRLLLVLIALKGVCLASEWTKIKYSVGFPQNLGSGSLSIWVLYSDVPRLNRTSLAIYPDLYRLRIETCNLLYIDEGAFDNNLMVKFLALVNLPLKQLPATLGPVQMSAFWIQLDKVNTAMTNLTGGNYFLEFPKIARLSLGNHEVLGPHLNTDILPQHLRYLYLPNCKLEYFPNLSDAVPHLQHLRIHRNNIKVIPEGCIMALKRMKTCYIQSNLIGALPDISFMTDLNQLGINDNNLTKLPDMYDLPFEKLLVARNPLICDQTLCWLRMWPWRKASILQDQPTCAGSGMLSGRKLMDVHPVDMQCYQGKHCEAVRPHIHFKVKKS